MMTEESPWTAFDVVINLLFLVSVMIVSTIMLVNKAAWVFLVLFYVFFVLYITVGRYMTCRHCDFLGKPCPSWCMGIFGAKLGFKRSEKKNFCEGSGKLYLFLFDVSFIVIAALIPVIVYVIEALTIGLLLLDWVLLLIYIGLILALLITHSLTGCRKCPIADCPLHMTKK